MKALKCKPSACFLVLTEVCLGSRDAMSLCLMYIVCKYVNGNVYKHSVLLEKNHHKAYEFVRRLLRREHA